MARPDQSGFVAHFTKDGANFDPSQERIDLTPDKMSAFEKLRNILVEKRIIATKMPWTDKKAVCFTECPWGSLLHHARQYSGYGIGFKKSFLNNRNGNPVIYANPSMFNAENWDPKVFPFVTPFVPKYASKAIKKQPPFNGRYLDYSHEREWRVVKDLRFKYDSIQFVVLEKVSDLALIPETIKEEIGVEKFLFMDTYRKIEELWPTHIID